MKVYIIVITQNRGIMSGEGVTKSKSQTIPLMTRIQILV